MSAHEYIRYYGEACLAINWGEFRVMFTTTLLRTKQGMPYETQACLTALHIHLNTKTLNYPYLTENESMKQR